MEKNPISKKKKKEKEWKVWTPIKLREMFGNKKRVMEKEMEKQKKKLIDVTWV